MQKLTIVTPSFQQGQFIERTIQSVLQQNYANLEYLVFDGGSTDQTIDILKKYDEHLQWVSQPDKGQADAVNKGITASSGDIIGWINSDDIYYPHAFTSVMQFFADNPQVNIVYGRADHIDIFDKPFEEYPTELFNFERLMDVCFICQPSVFFRKSIFQQFGLLRADLNYCMDYEFWLRLAKNKVNFGHIPEKLAGSRFYPDTKTLGARKKVHYEINKMHKETFGKVPTRWLINYAHVTLENKLCRNKNPYRYIISLIIHSYWLSLYWNKSWDNNMYQIFLKARPRYDKHLK